MAKSKSDEITALEQEVADLKARLDSYAPLFEQLQLELFRFRRILIANDAYKAAGASAQELYEKVRAVREEAGQQTDRYLRGVV